MHTLMDNDTRKQQLIKTLLQKGIYKKGEKQLYMLTLNELENIYARPKKINTITGNGVVTVEQATFAAGCFWGVEALFQQLNGVISTAAGFTGGETINPTYEDVYSELTGHAESVQVEYDPSLISYEELVEVFFENHNPTSLNRQGEDIGTRYRSAIFFHSNEQAEIALIAKENLERSGRFKKPIVTQIVPITSFYRADEYHQSYLAKRGQSSCKIS
ncbi:peptide-methionine (S)-S-oxide reductase MsrA [Pseudalkalibacillus hwajinpoensis]|uniref:peptide-methionine (S)-S-oxide reductase MsrA n=1 Tax=Guptibacillus hwajinpoensis TaxID=208199 RepID=UPI001CD58D02|nr:peptide-methionine (S)-S-oxide reductase MsrA [Pseudalkalibacillus hwajinpoensis]MCA0990432.1 peptide-methionine (S)-S-oxide reductase MsrA [Pseudalkalibacillus hwajinpoensis]